MPKFGTPTLNQRGANNLANKRRQPLTGLEANPAQRISPRRFAGFVAAN
jgi:hypothetical protein